MPAREPQFTSGAATDYHDIAPARRQWPPPRHRHDAHAAAISCVAICAVYSRVPAIMPAFTIRRHEYAAAAVRIDHQTSDQAIVRRVCVRVV